MVKLKRLSERFYVTILGMTVPFYMLSYGAAGHKLSLEPEDRNWLIIIIFSLVVAILYLISRKFSGKAMTFIKIVFSLTLLAMLYGGILILWSMINFGFGDDAALLVQLIFYFIPLLFILSIINIGYGLYKNRTE